MVNQELKLGTKIYLIDISTEMTNIPDPQPANMNETIHDIQ